MEETLNLRSKARDLLTTPSHEGAEILIEQLSTMPQETKEFKTAQTLYKFCLDNFPNCLTLMFLNLYLRSSSNDVIRFRSLYLLFETLAKIRYRNLELSRITLQEIKPLVIKSLTMQETKDECEMMYLRRVVSLVTYNVVICDGGWHELSDCILWLASTEHVKAFHIFIDLPPMYGTFIDKFLNLIVEKAEKVLLNPEKDKVEDWSLALQTIVKIGVQLSDTEMRYVRMVNKLFSILEKSVKDLVEKGMEQVLVKGLEHLERFLSVDKNTYDNYNKEQCHVVMAFMLKIKDVGTQSKKIIEKINQLVKTQDNAVSKPVVKPEKAQDDGVEFDRGWFDYLKTLSSLEVLKIFASTNLEDRSREMAIIQLNVLLYDHTSSRVRIDFSVIRELQPLLISCLRQEGITDNMFKVLGEVVNHVATELFKHQDVTWYALRNYIISQGKEEFQRRVYIFQCLTMPLEDGEFVIPVIEVLLPEISRSLNPPTELLVDNSCWVLSFTGAFFAAIHLIEISSHAEHLKEIANKMIDSVRKLVEREIEVGLVRRAFRDVEGTVKKQLRWYGTSEYKLVKGLLWRLYKIKDMKWESKIVLWRINVIVERGVDEMVKELPENEFDWLNLPEA